MPHQWIQNSLGKVIGSVSSQGNGDSVYSVPGRSVAFYTRSNDSTFDPKTKRFTKGNIGLAIVYRESGQY